MALKAAKKTGFVYKPRSTTQVKERANRKAGLFDSIFKQGTDEFRPKTGDNTVRYLPPTWDDSDHYAYTAFVHNNIGPDNSTYLCLRKMLNKPCPCCEAQKEAKDAGEGDEAKALSTSERCISYVLDRDGDDPEKPLVYNQSWTQDRDVSALCINERSGTVLMIDHPDTGYDVSFKRQGTGLKTKYYGWQVSREESSIHDKQSVQDEILDYIKDNPIPDLLNFFDYDYLKGVLSGVVAKEDVDLEEKPKTSRKPEPEVARRGPRRDEEVDPEEEEEEEEEVVEKPARGAKRGAPPPEDEEVNEEEEEPTPQRRTAPARSRVVEEPEEEEEVVPVRRARK